MQKFDSTFTTESSNPQSMSYYLMIRETIHGLDRLIVTVVYQSVTIITGSLTLGILLFEKIENLLHASILACFLTFVAILLTYNSQKRIKLYTDILVQKVKVAEKLEDLLFSNGSIKITQQIEKNVKYAGMKGESIFLRSTKVFYLIESALLSYFVIKAIFMIFKQQV